MVESSQTALIGVAVTAVGIIVGAIVTLRVGQNTARNLAEANERQRRADLENERQAFEERRDAELRDLRDECRSYRLENATLHETVATLRQQVAQRRLTRPREHRTSRPKGPDDDEPP